MPRLYTKNGHDFYEMASLYQKAIRRSDLEKAGYAANELFGRYYHFLWNRTLIISAEDVAGVITKEIWALYQACQKVNKNKKGYDRETIFISKAMTLLAHAYKSRDSTYVACNYFLSEEKLDVKELEDYTLDEPIPEYTYDVHTLEGKRRGKTIKDMVEDEEKGLKPKQVGLFDDLDWDTLYKYHRKKINKDTEYPKPDRKEVKEIEKKEQDDFADLWDEISKE